MREDNEILVKIEMRCLSEDPVTFFPTLGNVVLTVKTGNNRISKQIRELLLEKITLPIY